MIDIWSNERSNESPWAQSVPPFRFYNADLALHRRGSSVRWDWSLVATLTRMKCARLLFSVACLIVLTGCERQGN